MPDQKLNNSATPFAMALVFTAVIAACSVQNPSVPPAHVTDYALGTWNSNCVEGKYLALLATGEVGITQRTTLVVDKETMSEISTISRAGCSESDISVTVDTSLKREATEKPGIKSFDAKVPGYRVKPLTTFGVKVLNLSEWCGIKDWAIGQERDVLATVGEDSPRGRKCFKSRQIATIYAADSRNLYFGQAAEVFGSSSENDLRLKQAFYFTRGEEK